MAFLLGETSSQPDASVGDGGGEAKEEEVLVLDGDKGEGELDLVGWKVFVRSHHSNFFSQKHPETGYISERRATCRKR